MSDETFEYITTDYMISIESNEQTIQPVEYIVELGQEGIPGRQGDKGDPGYSPTITYVGNEEGIQFNIINETETFTTPAVPLKSYVDTAFLKVDGSNANNPITLNGLTINKSGGSPIVTGDINLYLRGSQVAISANPSLNPTVGISVQPNTISLGDMNTKYLVADTDTVKYGRLGQQSEIATLADIPSVTNFLEVDGSNADANFTVNGIKLAGNYVYIDGVSYGGIHATQTNSNIYYQLGVDSNRAFLSMPSLTLNSYPAISSGGMYSPADTIMNVSSNMRISLSGSNKLYYGSSNTANNEVAIKGDIPTVSDATITINQGGVTKGTFTLNGSATTIDLDAGSGAITNPLVIPSDSGNQSISIGFLPGTSTAFFKETLSLPGTSDIDLPLHLINSSSYPISLTKNTSSGLTTLGLAYDSTTLGLNADNELTVIGGGTSYTAGTGITIDTSDVIAVDFTEVATATQGGKADTAVQPGDLATVATTGNYDDLINKPTIPDTTYMVTTNTAQTISGSKTFSSETHHTGVITFDSAMLNPIIRGMSGSSHRNMIYRMGNDSAITVGNSSDTIDLKGSGTRPTYNSGALALYSDIPSLSGYATETWVGNQGYITGISSTDVTTALGYTPYDSSNPSGYTSNIGTVTSVNNTSPDANGNVALSIPSTTNFVTTNTAQDISGRKTFLGEKAIYFKQSTANNKLGFTLYNTSNTEVGALEYRPGTISGTPLLALNSGGSTYVGFRYWTSGKPMNYYVPLPNNTTLTSGDYCLTLGIKSNTTNAVAGTDGLIDLTTFIDTSVSSSSTNYKVPSSKLFYDTVGDIETLINAL